MKKKTKIMIGIIIALIVFFIIPISSYLVAKVDLLLKGDVSISIDPQEKTLVVDRGDTQTILFTTAIDNTRFCEAACDFAFYDLGKDSQLDNGTFKGERGTIIKKIYSILSPKKGQGQLAYRFDVSCTNKKSFLCQVDPSRRTRSSFITLSYELSVEEREFKEDVRQRLIGSLIRLNEADITARMMSQRMNIQNGYLIMDDLLGRANALQEDIDSLIDISSAMKKKWAEEEYEYIDENLEELNAGILLANNSRYKLEEDASRRIAAHLAEAKNLDLFKNRIPSLLELDTAEIILGESDDSFRSDDALLRYESLVYRFNTKNYSDYLKITEDLFFLNKKVTSEYGLVEEKLVDKANAGLALLAGDTNKTYGATDNMSEAIDSFGIICDAVAANKTDKSAPTNDTLIFFSNSTSDFAEKHCANYSRGEWIGIGASGNLSDYDITIRLPPENITTVADQRVTLDLAEHKEICCIFGECKTCCEGISCAKDVHPVILIHGHAFSKDATVEYSLTGFDKIRRKLASDGYIDVGTILPSNDFIARDGGIYGRFGKPVVAGTTYYVDVYDEEGRLIGPPSRSESIKTYAIRLNKTIELLKYKTGADKIDIMAYSMGGLVARQYLVDFGEESVNKLITIDTPNHGVYGKIESICPIAGQRIECEEMATTSGFMNELNDPKNEPKKTKVYSIIGTGCPMDGKDGDGVALGENQRLPFSLNFDIVGNCDANTLHEDILDTEKYPKVYDTIKSILKN